MEYAVVTVQGKQYKVTPGQKLVVDRVASEKDQKLTFDTVLLHSNGDTITVGSPTITGATVSAKVLDHSRGKKIAVLRFRAKSHYHKSRGHRQEQSQLLIESIAMPKAKKEKAASV